MQRICRDQDLWCFNPLWQTNQIDYLRRLLKEDFSIIISGVYAYPFDASWLGARLTEERIQMLERLQKKYKINPSGEGGELETFVLDGPILPEENRDHEGIPELCQLPGAVCHRRDAAGGETSAGK